jgi:hypothetical protein
LRGGCDGLLCGGLLEVGDDFASFFVEAHDGDAIASLKQERHELLAQSRFVFSILLVFVVD